MAKDKSQARREHLARMRAEQKRKERRVALLMWGIGGLVIVVLVGLVAVYVVNDRSSKSLDGVASYKYEAPTTAGTRSPTPRRRPSAAGTTTSGRTAASMTSPSTTSMPSTRWSTARCGSPISPTCRRRRWTS